jgi:hypothetical protein
VQGIVPLCVAVALGAGCSVGEGQGEITAAVHVEGFCEVDEEAFELAPSFFSAEVTEELLDLRVQRGSQIESNSDGLYINVRDVNDVARQRIGLPIPISDADDALVRLVFFLNATCPTGFPEEFRESPVNLKAVSGTITFREIYAPEIDPGATGISAELTGVYCEDPDVPDERHATLDGWFSFFYQRGAPAQRFP